MAYETVKKIIDEISSDEFKSNHQIWRIEVGENGDAFLNKDIIRILRYIKHKLPNINIEIFTNFQHFTEEIAGTIISEALLDSVNVNIDGSNNDNFHRVKKLSLDDVKTNLDCFLKLREKHKSNMPLTVYVLTLHTYIHSVRKHLGFSPAKLEDETLFDVEDDASTVESQLEKIIDPHKDSIKIVSNPTAWAERGKIDITQIDYSKYVCPKLKRVEKEAFIAPDGTWYACCYDTNCELALGNIHKQSIEDIYKSEWRHKLIQLLKEKQFGSINGPCKTVIACQDLGKPKHRRRARMLNKIRTILQRKG